MKNNIKFVRTRDAITLENVSYDVFLDWVNHDLKTQILTIDKWGDVHMYQVQQNCTGKEITFVTKEEFIENNHFGKEYWNKFKEILLGYDIDD